MLVQARLEAQGLYGHLGAQAQACVMLQAWWHLQAGCSDKAAADLSFLLGCKPRAGEERGRLRALCAHALIRAQRPHQAMRLASLAKEEAPHNRLVQVRRPIQMA